MHNIPPGLEICEHLKQTFPSEPWQAILEGFSITGLLDTEQLQAISGLERMKLSRLLNKLRAALPEGQPPLLIRLEQPIRRPGDRGRAPVVWVLGESGAAALRDLGYPDARACGLREPVAVSHALAMNDVHLAARRAGIDIQTDRTLPYGDGQSLRPDHQVRLREGKLRLFEIEQSASPETLRRVQASLARKQAFFSSPQASGIEPVVFLLLQTAPKQQAETLKTWQKAWSITAAKHPQGLNFRLRLMRLQEFLTEPDWAGQQTERWQEIIPPASPLVSLEAPSALLRRTAREDHLVLAALWQDFQESAQARRADFQPDPDFLRVIRLIYAASHDPELPPLTQAGLPHASLYLLKEYLAMHGLRGPLRAALNNGRGQVRWNPITIVHRMQIVADTFLAWHGWRADGPLWVTASAPRWDVVEHQTFQLRVSIRDPRILPESEEPAPSERALTWVLWAIFAYGPELGLGKTEFW